MARFKLSDTFMAQRNAMVQRIVSASVDGFVRQQKKAKDDGEKPQFDERRCLATGKLFVPKSRWNFFIDEDARKMYYRGQIRPRHPN